MRELHVYVDPAGPYGPDLSRCGLAGEGVNILDSPTYWVTSERQRIRSLYELKKGLGESTILTPSLNHQAWVQNRNIPFC